MTSVDATAVVEALTFDAAGLIPAVIQDHTTREVLMVAWMDAAAVIATIHEGRTVFWSRSRQQLWRKGATSGDVQHVREVLVDCDRDTLLVTVDQHGVGACHTGAVSCFFRSVDELTPLPHRASETSEATVAGDASSAVAASHLAIDSDATQDATT